MIETKRTAAQIRAYCEAATKGPWANWSTSEFCALVKVHEKHAGGAEELLRSTNAKADGDFCVNARTDLPRALDAAVTLWEARRSDRRLMLLMAWPTISEKELEREVMQDTLLSDTAWLLEEATDGST